MRKNKTPPAPVEVPAEKPSKVVARNGAFLKEYAFKHEWGIDEGLANGVLDVVGSTRARTIADFGAGAGKYVQHWRRKAYKAQGFDGILNVESLSNHSVSYADLSTPKEFRIKWDWVVCLDVGGYIPKDRTAVFLNNLTSHANMGVIVTWQPPDMRGKGIVNPLTEEQVIEMFQSVGYVREPGLSKLIYRRASRKIRRRVHVFVPAPPKKPV